MKTKTSVKFTHTNTWAMCKRELRKSFDSAMHNMREQYRDDAAACRKLIDEARRERDAMLNYAKSKERELARPLPTLARCMRAVFHVKV